MVDEGDIAIKNMEELKVGDVHARYLAEIARRLEPWPAARWSGS